MRKALLFTYDFPPRGATGVFRVTKFARYLPEFGWHPVVVTAAGEGAVRDEALLHELPPNLEVIRVADPSMPLRRGVFVVQPSRTLNKREGLQQSTSTAVTRSMRQRMRRLLIPDPQVLWLPQAVRAATARLRWGDIDAILTTSPPHSMQLGGLWIKRRFPRLPWIMDLRDLWSDSGTIDDLISYKLNHRLESACLRAADRVVVVTEAMRRVLLDESDLLEKQIVTMTNGFDTRDIQPTNLVPSPNGPLQIVYVGTIISTRTAAARGLFHALDRLSRAGIDRDSLVVRFYGLFDEQIHRWAGPLIERGIVQLHPFVSHAEAIATMASAHALLLLMSDDREGRIAVPNKLYEYMAVGRPVLALAPPGEVTRLVETHAVGVAVPPSDVNAIERALEQLIAQHRSGALPQVTPNDPRLRRFERRELARRLATLLDEMVI